MTPTPPRSTPHGAPEPEPTFTAGLGALLGDDAAAEATVAELRAAMLTPVDEDVASAHLTAMFAAADGVIGEAGATEELVSPAPVVDLRARRRGRRAAIAGAVAIGVTTLTGGLAAANTLPAPIQDAVSRVADVFSISVPTADERVDPEVDDRPGTSTSTSVPADTTNPTRPGPATGTPGSTAPGVTGETPGQTGSTPGDTAPGQTGDAPGHSGDAPGQSGTTPGHSGSRPGNSGNGSGPPASNPGNGPDGSGPPGVSGERPGNSGSAPGHSGAPGNGPDGSGSPGAARPTPGNSGNGADRPETPALTAPGSPGQGHNGQGSSSQGNNGQGNNGQGNNGQGNNGQGNNGQDNNGQGNNGRGESGQGNPGRP